MSYTILFADDDLAFTQLVVDYFQNNGYMLLWAKDGQEAIHLYKEHKPDLVILDLKMPGISGYEVAKEIRKIDSVTTIWLYTNLKDYISAERGYMAGADDFIRKDLGKNELLLKVNNFFIKNKAIKVQNQLFITPDTYLDNENNILHVKDQSEKLSFRESNLLRLLVLNKNKPIKRVSLIINVWSNNLYAEEGLNKGITKLRKLLEKDKRIKLKTKRGDSTMLIVEEDS